MEKRVFLAIFLSFLVLVIYETQFAPKPAVVPPAATTASPVASPAPGPAAAPTPASGAATAPAAPTPAPGAAPAVPDANARDVIVETDSVTAVFSTQGAALKSYRLRRYADARGESLELVPADEAATES